MPTDTAEETDDLPKVDEGFHVIDAATANWLVRRVLFSRAYCERVQQWAAVEIRRAEREEAFFLGRWGHELENWGRQQIMALHRRKSINLPAGTIGFRVEPQKLNFLDEGRLLVWCRRNLPRAVKTTENILKSVVTEHLKRTGEVPDGAEIIGGEEKFFIR